jgi:hypothetical protein
MPCCIGVFALVAPRIAIVLVVLFSDYIGEAYRTVLWPLLGFVFAPLTTLAYAWAKHTGTGSVEGFPLVVVVLAVLIDFGVIGGGARNMRRDEE